MLHPKDHTFGAFNYVEKYYLCGYKFELNVSFDKRGIRNFCVLEGEKFQVESMFYARKKRVICPKCRRSLKTRKVVSVVKHS